MTVLNIQTVEGIVVGQYGVAVPLSVKDEDGNAADLSAYTAAVVRSISKDAQSTLQWTGTITSATGGTLTFTPSSGTTWTVDGNWESQVQFTDTGVFMMTVPFVIEVHKQI